MKVAIEIQLTEYLSAKELAALVDASAEAETTVESIVAEALREKARSIREKTAEKLPAA